jgi:hypothetical protein
MNEVSTKALLATEATYISIFERLGLHIFEVTIDALIVTENTS